MSSAADLVKKKTIYGIIFVTVLVDQVTKYFAVAGLKGQPEISFLGGIFRLTYAENRGAFLSFGAGLPDGLRFHIFTLGVGLFLAFALRHVMKNRDNALQTLAMAFLIGGGVGNLIDRALYGYVIDFLFTGYGYVRTGVFNVADMAILFAVMAILGESLIEKFQKKESVAKNNASHEA